MDNERYKIVVHDTEPQYTSNCPILLQALAITKDNEKNQVLAQCKFENLGYKQIAAIYISIKCCAIDDKSLEDLEHFAYMDLKARQYDEFGDRVPIYLPDNETRKIVITLKKVVYEDGTVWENKENIPYTKFTFSVSPLSSLKPLDEQYRRELQKISPKWAKHNDLPAYTDIFVRCGCGEILVNEDNAVCPKCKVALTKLIKIQDKEYLKKKVEEYEKTEKENREKIQQEIESKKIVIKKIEVRQHILKYVFGLLNLIWLLLAFAIPVFEFMPFTTHYGSTTISITLESEIRMNLMLGTGFVGNDSDMKIIAIIILAICATIISIVAMIKNKFLPTLAAPAMFLIVMTASIARQVTVLFDTTGMYPVEFEKIVINPFVYAVEWILTILLLAISVIMIKQHSATQGFKKESRQEIKKSV